MSAPSESEEPPDVSSEGLPSFLRKSRLLRDRFPEEFYSPHDDIEVELSTSFETLLETEDASELMLQFLSEGHRRTNIVWLSNDTFISNQDDLSGCWVSLPLDCVFTAHIRLPENDDDDDDDDGYLHHVFRNRLPSVSFYRIARSSIPITSLVAPTDALLRILAKERLISKIVLCKHNISDEYQPPIFSADHSFPRVESFPASLAALQGFVSDAASPRALNFDGAALTSDQWRAVVFNCHKTNVDLHIRDISICLGTSGGNPLAEAMRLNQCPTKLEIYIFKMTENQIKELMAALEVNTSLKELTVSIAMRRPELLYGAISRNKGLEYLKLQGFDSMKDSDWELFWGTAIATHPTLKALHLDELVTRRSEVRDQILVQSLRSNKVLCRLECKKILYGKGIFEEKINPILQFNRFRPRVQAIKNEHDPLLRERLFSLMLLHLQVIGSDRHDDRGHNDDQSYDYRDDQSYDHSVDHSVVHSDDLSYDDKDDHKVDHKDDNNDDHKDDHNDNNNTRQCLSLCYFLLKENRDLLVKFSCLKDVLVRQWNEALHRLAAVEERMNNSDIDAPSLDAFLGKRKRP